MTRHKTDVVTERKQAFPNRTDQIVVIAARKIAATDTAGEDHVTNERQLRRRMMKDDVTRRVARTMEHVEAQAAERSEEHTSELQSLMRISYAVFCLKKKKI